MEDNLTKQVVVGSPLKKYLHPWSVLDGRLSTSVPTTARTEYSSRRDSETTVVNKRIVRECTPTSTKDVKD